MTYFQVIFVTLVSLLVYRFARLIHNYREARKIGLPTLVVPVNWQDPIWIPAEKKFAWLRNLPWGLGAWYKHTVFGWSLKDRYATHERLGGAFTIVTPHRNEIVLCDPANIHEAIGKYKKWPRPKEIYSIFETFGYNVNTVNGEEWQKHRKVINQAFAESNMDAVWEGAMKQVAQWLDRLSGERDLEQIALDCDTMSANVLMHAAFDQDRDFETGFHEVRPGHKNGFGETMLYMTRNIILAWALGRAALPKWIEPNFLTTIRQAKKELRLYFEETLERRHGVLTKALLQANEDEKANGRIHLEREEIYGNLFMINVAGFDTTSYALQFSIYSLAINPEVQEWARRDLSTYKDSFHKAVRLRALMYETLRLYGSAPPLLRLSPETQTMFINGQDRFIPAMTYVTSNLSAPNNNPGVWGGDVLEWKPSRWIEIIDGEEHLRTEEMYSWSTGPRICPGKKFSQVEFVAVIGTLLQKFRIEGSPGLKGIIDDFEFNITPKVKRPKDARINFVRR